jgi:hypothetical protein
MKNGAGRSPLMSKRSRNRGDVRFPKSSTKQLLDQEKNRISKKERAVCQIAGILLGNDVWPTWHERNWPLRVDDSTVQIWVRRCHEESMSQIVNDYWQ